MHVRSAELLDGSEIRSLLKICDLPSEDIDNHLADFIVASEGASIIGVVGLEILEASPILDPKGLRISSSNADPKVGYALLRSLAVAESWRGRGLATTLCGVILEKALRLRIADLYLLTTTAERFFLKLGFSVIDRADVPDEVSATEEFRNLCPSTAVCMRRTIILNETVMEVRA